MLAERSPVVASRSPVAEAIHAERVVDSVVGPGAVVAGTAVRSVIGAGALVEGHVEDAVIWPGATVAPDEHLSCAVRLDGPERTQTVLVR